MTNLINDINKDWKKFDNNQQTTFLKSIGYKVVKKELVASLEDNSVSLVDITAKQLNKMITGRKNKLMPTIKKTAQTTVSYYKVSHVLRLAIPCAPISSGILNIKRKL